MERFAKEEKSICGVIVQYMVMVIAIDIFIRMVSINHIIIQLHVIAVGTEVVQDVVAVIIVMSFIMLK